MAELRCGDCPPARRGVRPSPACTCLHSVACSRRWGGLHGVVVALSGWAQNAWVPQEVPGGLGSRARRCGGPTPCTGLGIRLPVRRHCRHGMRAICMRGLRQGICRPTGRAAAREWDTRAAGLPAGCALQGQTSQT